MGLKKSTGNMYDWVTHMHTHLGGECPHKCTYCYIDNPRWGRHERYCGEVRLIEKELKVSYRSKEEPKTIFIEHFHDLFADAIPTDYIDQILAHCRSCEENTYVFQTKNPERLISFLGELPTKRIIGTTIETNYANIASKVSMAPSPSYRLWAMESIKSPKFVTIEPILELNPESMISWMKRIKPDFINIGADSKGHGLQEPSKETVEKLITTLQEGGFSIRKKSNLKRLLEK